MTDISPPRLFPPPKHHRPHRRYKTPPLPISAKGARDRSHQDSLLGRLRSGRGRSGGGVLPRGGPSLANVSADRVRLDTGMMGNDSGDLHRLKGCCFGIMCS